MASRVVLFQLLQARDGRGQGSRLGAEWPCILQELQELLSMLLQLMHWRRSGMQRSGQLYGLCRYAAPTLAPRRPEGRQLARSGTASTQCTAATQQAHHAASSALACTICGKSGRDRGLGARHRRHSPMRKGSPSVGGGSDLFWNPTAPTTCKAEMKNDRQWS